MKIPAASAKPKNGRVVVRWDWEHHHSHTKQIFFYKRVRRITVPTMTFKDFMTTVAKITLNRVKEICAMRK